MNLKGYIDQTYAEHFLQKRAANIHKGDCGRILIVAGTAEMAGAAVLAGKGAIRSGSGLVHMCTDRSIFPIIQISQPELICTTWEDAEKDLNRFDAIAAGPGLGVNSRTADIVEKLIREFHKTVIFDADALNTLAENEDLQKVLSRRGNSVIMTPHIGEAARLLNDESVKKQNKQEIADALIHKFGCNVVIKGAATLVGTSENEALINTTGNPGMATAGSGDVLTGVVTSFAGQGMSPGNAAAAGVYVHGLAGDIAAEAFGEYGLTSGNIAENIPAAIKNIVGR